jgi:hypothetical protein
MIINDAGAAPVPNSILAIMAYHDSMVTEFSHSLIEELVTVNSQLKGGYSSVGNGNSRNMDAVAPKMIIECYLGLRGGPCEDLNVLRICNFICTIFTHCQMCWKCVISKIKN